MAISTDMSYLQSTSDMANASAAASSLTSSLSSVSSSSTETEMKDAIEEFEKYFLEQIMEDVEESLKSDDEESSSVSQTTEYFMSTMNTKLAEELISQSGERFTQTMYDQMCRNYGISPVSPQEADTTVIKEEETKIDDVEAIQNSGIQMDV